MDINTNDKTEKVLIKYAKNNGITEENIMFLLNSQNDIKKAVQKLSHEKKEEILKNADKDKIKEIEDIIKSIN